MGNVQLIQRRGLITQARAIADLDKRRRWLLCQRYDFARDIESARRRGAADEESDAAYYANGLYAELAETERKLLMEYL